LSVRTGSRGAAAPVGLRNLGELLAWLGAIVLTLGPFMAWYTISGDLRGTLSITGWNTGTAGKLVFVAGFVALVLLSLRAAGIELPPQVPSGMVVAGLGFVGTILILIRLIDIPERFQPSVGRALGIWVSLLAALLMIVAGLLKSADEA
jgi:hypothetical protein